MNKSKLKQVATVTGLFLGAFAISVLAAGEWTPAPCEAPQCNASAPINVSSADQTKDGSLTVGGSLSVSGAKVTASGASLDVNGFGLFTGLNISGMTSTNQITVLENGANTQNYVLTNKGGGVGEWKAPSAGGITLSKVVFFPLLMARNQNSNEQKSFDTPESYLFCAMTRIDAEMSRVNSNQGAGYCQITKKVDGKWKLTGFTTANNPDFTCEMVCFK
jgi:hypothetical protein